MVLRRLDAKEARGLMFALLGLLILMVDPFRWLFDCLDSLLEASEMAICVEKSSRKRLFDWSIVYAPGE